MKRVAASGLSLALAAVIPAMATAGRGHWSIINIGGFSAEASPHQAVAGAHIAGRERQPGSRWRPRPAAEANREPHVAQPPPLLALPSSSPLLQKAHPLGTATLWYQGAGGQSCVYLPTGAPLCFAIVQPNGGRLDPSLVAAELGRAMALALPPIEASPSASRNGLAGAVSWFWLDGALAQRSVTVRLGAEAVTVRADPSATSWSFGDGGIETGGPGIAYRQGPVPDDAITHVYETRCLPGDQGRDPNVLPSCGSDGYAVVARVRWRISFVATGPVSVSGLLPARTTESSLTYAVSEARAFLATGGSA